MTTRRITVSVPETLALRIEQAADRTGSVSSWIAKAIAQSLAEEELERRFLDFCATVESSAAENKRAAAALQQIVRGKARPQTTAKARRGKKVA